MGLGLPLDSSAFIEIYRQGNFVHMLFSTYARRLVVLVPSTMLEEKIPSTVEYAYCLGQPQ
jgi:hypothetical protein